MKILDIIKKYKAAILDPERDFTERVFLIYSLISEIGVFICLIGDIIMKEYIEEIYTLILIIVTVMLVTVICLIKDRLKEASKAVAFSGSYLLSCT